MITSNPMREPTGKVNAQTDAPGSGLSRIRGMERDDLPGVLAIERENYQYPWGEGIFRDCMRVGYYCRVLVLDEELLGYGILSVIAGEAHILNICISKKLHRHGLGQKMLDHLVSLARKSSAVIVFLEVRPTNTGAIALYRANGFDQIGVRKKYYASRQGREDALVLALQFS